MLLVPLTGDKLALKSTEGGVKVSSYTALKPEPAVYITEPLESGDRFVLFSDIMSVNGIEVTLDSSGLLKASSLLKRKYNLPQIGDTITTSLVDTAFKQEFMELKVTNVTISGREPRSIIVKCGTTSLSLADITDIKRKRGFEIFNHAAFVRYYSDYMPLGSKE